MQAFPTLPGALYLLAVDPSKERLTGGRYLRQALPAAALAELWLRGLVVEVDGRPVTAEGAARTGDRPLDAMLELVAARSGSWEERITDETAPAALEIAAQLAEDGWIELRARRTLGVFTTDRVVRGRPGEIAELENDTASALIGRDAVDAMEPRRAALGALVGMTGLRTVRGGRVRRDRRERFEQLVLRAGPAVAALEAVYDDDGMEALRSE